MFSTEYYREIKNAFDRQMALLDQRYQELQNSQSENGKNESGAAQYGDHMPELSGQLLFEKKEEIMDTLARCTEDEAQALTFLYSAMPVSDLLDYPASLFLSYAKHGVFLWNQGAFAGRVPEKLFANYVLHYRINNEDIADTRGFFHDRIKEAVDLNAASSGTMYDTAKDVNYWCAREATYRSTDGRTQNPRTMYGTAAGRCGEESTFAVTALRSIGIPARQIYAPLWTHCDDNHAWVELWCDGKWYFLGACEPEEELNRGWFTGPAYRAVMLHSRWFGKDAPEDRQVGPKGMAKVLNHMERYAHTVELEVKVEDENGSPVPNAKVDFQVLNHGSFGSVAVVYTGSEGADCGIARLTTGFGDLYISVSAEAGGSLGTDLTGGKIPGNILYGETMVSPGSIGNTGEKASSGSMESAGETDGKGGDGTVRCKVVLKSVPECWEGWKDLDMHAPEAGSLYEGELTAAQQETGNKRLTQAAEYRQKKNESFYNEREAERVLGRFDEKEREEVKEILHKAHSNMGEIVRFLEWDGDCFLPAGCRTASAGQDSSSTAHGGRRNGLNGNDGWKLRVLNTLSEKDYWDVKADILIDCCINAFAYAEDVPEDIFYSFLLCPRVSLEMLRPCRIALKKYWEEYTDSGVKKMLEQNPGCLPELADKWIISVKDQEYEDLITSSLGCLRGGMGSRYSKKVFCVNLYRALGIPARLNHFDGRVEYYKDGKFVSSDGEEKSSSLTLCADGTLKLSDWEHFSLEHFEENGFRRMGLWEQLTHMEDNVLELQVTPGIYRIVTTNRRKNGDQMARVAMFALQKGQSRKMTVSMRETAVKDMLTHIQVEDFALKAMDGERDAGMLSDLSDGGKALFLWLGVTREPTEHILNELYDMREEFSSLKAPVYAILKAPEDLENVTLHRTLEALPEIHTVMDDFGDNYRRLAQTVGQEPGKLPLAVILNGQQECIYSDAGYNVGLADMLYKILV